MKNTQWHTGHYISKRPEPKGEGACTREELERCMELALLKAVNHDDEGQFEYALVLEDALQDREKKYFPFYLRYRAQY